jgi:hypothetical protein
VRSSKLKPQRKRAPLEKVSRKTPTGHEPSGSKLTS